MDHLATQLLRQNYSVHLERDTLLAAGSTSVTSNVGNASGARDNGLAAANHRGREGGRALNDGASKASVCRSFKVPRSTLIDTLKRIGWMGAGKG